MAYAETSDVAGEFKNITFSSTTNVTSTDIENFIDQASALIDSYVGQKYSVPVTEGTSTLNLLKMFCVTLVADRIKKILEVKQETSKQLNQSTRGAFSTRDVLDMLVKIAKGELSLVGATSELADGGFYSNNYENNIETKFKITKEQW